MISIGQGGLGGVPFGFNSGLFFESQYSDKPYKFVNKRKVDTGCAEVD